MGLIRQRDMIQKWRVKTKKQPPATGSSSNGGEGAPSYRLWRQDSVHVIDEEYIKNNSNQADEVDKTCPDWREKMVEAEVDEFLKSSDRLSRKSGSGKSDQNKRDTSSQTGDELLEFYIPGLRRRSTKSSSKSSHGESSKRSSRTSSRLSIGNDSTGVLTPLLVDDEHTCDKHTDTHGASEGKRSCSPIPPHLQSGVSPGSDKTLKDSIELTPIAKKRCMYQDSQNDSTDTTTTVVPSFPEDESPAEPQKLIESDMQPTKHTTKPNDDGDVFSENTPLLSISEAGSCEASPSKTCPKPDSTMSPGSGRRSVLSTDSTVSDISRDTASPKSLEEMSFTGLKLLDEEEDSVEQFRAYLRTKGMELDLNSVQSSDV